MAKALKLEQLIELGLEKSVAEDMLRRVNQSLASLPASECWRKISQEVLIPSHPFQLHKLLHETVFSDWDSKKGPPPAWLPSDELMQTANIARLMKALKLNSYEELHAWSVRNREDFWHLMIQRLGIRFKRECIQIMSLPRGAEYPQWLVNAKLNIADSCFNALSPPCGPPVNMEKHKDFDKKAFAQEGKRIYRQKYAKKLEPMERGKIIAIEIESGDSFSGDSFIGDSTVEAILKAKEKYPNKIFYLMRVGYDAVHSSKGFVPVLEENDAKVS